MAHSRGFPRGRTTATPRPTEWIIGPDAKDESLSATGIGIWTTGISTGVGGTIVRTRGFFSAFLRSTGAVGDGYFGAVGMAVVTAKAFAVGSTAIPGPLTEDEWDGWYYHQYFDVRSVTATIGDGVNAVSSTVRFDIDSKAMRKFDDQSTIIGVVEVIESGAAVVEFHAHTRQLVKLV